MNANNAGPTGMETLNGGSKLTVKFKDGSTREIKVRQLPVRDYQAYFESLQDECRQVELLVEGCNATGWADNLSYESHEAVVEEGKRINEAFFVRWLRRRMESINLLTGGAVKVSEASQISSPTSASPAA